MQAIKNKPNFSSKGQQLLNLYSQMANNGYMTSSGHKIEAAYNDFELVKFKQAASEQFGNYEIKSVLEYGCGGSDWENQHIFSGQSAKKYFSLDHIYRYEPARGIDEGAMADAVVCFDVMEHIFISDVPNVLRDVLSYASTLAVINVAC